MIRPRVGHVCNRCFQPLMGLNTARNIPTNVSSEFLELASEDINVGDCSFGSIVPSRKESMMGKGRRGGGGMSFQR